METVVATVSGYHGSERFNLIKLISHSGASYVGTMSRSTTHLVCWKHEGRKYELAKKFKTIIVNHRWIEDCIKQGKRVPEGPYILRSGKEVGPILLEVPLVVKGGTSTENPIVLCDKSNIFDDVEARSISRSSGAYGSAIWSDPCLLNKNLCPLKGDSTSYKSKHRLLKWTSKQNPGSSSRCSFKEPPLYGLLGHEDSSNHSKCLERDKRKIFHGNGSTTAECSRKGRRLIKKNANRDNLGPVILDSDPECYQSVGNKQHKDARASSRHSGGERNVYIFESRGTSDWLCSRMALGNGFEEIEDFDSQSTSKDPDIGIENASTTRTRNSQDEFTCVDTLKDPINEDHRIKNGDSSLPSTELSCIICWTDFSSTRGVLPCGHRFCYSCIRNWADHMASRRKVSTCPLCKTGFNSITMFEDAATSDQKIYSQTIPSGPSTVDIFMVADQETYIKSLGPVCTACRFTEPEDLLISCHLCQIRHIHSYCLDPLLLPWTCSPCKDLQRIYQRTV